MMRAIVIIILILPGYLFAQNNAPKEFDKKDKSSFGLKTGISMPVGDSNVPYILLGLEYRIRWPNGLGIAINGDLQVDTYFPFGDGLASLTGMVHYYIPGTPFYAGIGLSRYSIISYETSKTFGFSLDGGIIIKRFNFNIKYNYLPAVKEGTYDQYLWNYSHFSFTIGWWFKKK